MPVRLAVRPWFYPFVFVAFLVFVLPYALAVAFAPEAFHDLIPLGRDALLACAFVFIPNLLILAFVWWRCSQPGFSLWDGLKVMSARSMSGCSGIELAYILPLLFGVYLIALLYAIVGIIRGSDWTRKKWTRLTLRKPEA